MVKTELKKPHDAEEGPINIMPSDSFWAEFKDLSPNGFLDATTTLFAEMFPPEIRDEPAERFIAAIQALVPSKDDGVQLLQIDDFAETIGDPPPAIAKGFLSQKDLILISAKPKMCKSFLAMQILDDIARGKKILGKWEIEQQGTVVYLGMEDNPQEIKRRMIARGMIGHDLPFYAITGKMNLGNQEGISKLKAMLDKLPEPPITICIDTARVALGIEDWNNPAEVTKKILNVLDLARERCLVLLIAHNRKADGDGGDKISGSNAMQSNVDGYLIVESKRTISSGNVILDLEMETRSEAAQKFSVEMDTTTNIMHVLSEDAQKQANADKRSDQRRDWYKKFARIFNDKGEQSIKGLAEAMGLKYDFTYQVVNEMLEMEDVEKTGNTTPKSDKGRPAPLFAITKRGINYLLEQEVIGNSSQQIKNSLPSPEETAFFDGTAESTKTEDSDEWK
jgi:hypothetical protein